MKNSNRRETKVKLFTEPAGTFQILIPINWQYKNPLFKDQKMPHSFELYDRPIGAFQISCKLIDENSSTIIKNNELKVQTPSNNLHFEERHIKGEKFHVYIWLCAVDDHFIFITYTVDAKKVEQERVKREFLAIKNVVKTFKLIRPEYRSYVAAIRRYNMFMASYTTTLELRNRARKNGAFIEIVVLNANLIDALLRLAIILTTQLENNTGEIDTSVLFQEAGVKILSERNIYKYCLEREIIDSVLFNKLELLYKERNKVVHQFIITDILTEELLLIAKKYDDVEEEVGKLINDLEHRQYNLKIGMFTSENDPPDRRYNMEERKKIGFQVRDKHGRITWRDND